MKNKVLFTLLICLSTFISASAQTIPNYSFENWVADTNYLDLTLTNPVTLDTTVSQIPQGWTTSDEVTNGRVFHYQSQVTQSANSYVGSSAIQLRSDSLHAVFTGTVAGTITLNFVSPGFAVCGSFPINLASFVTLGTTFNPALLPGAGIPVSTGYDKIGGYMKYSPVGGDSAYVVAILRKGTTVVATATYTRSTTDAAYSYFEAPFIYQNCLIPDTMVYTISSGNPYSISNVAFGHSSNLHEGSTLLVDSIYLGNIAPFGIAYPKNDTAHTNINTAVKIPVTVNDSSCSVYVFNVDSVSLPKHGTAVIAGDSILYTPTAGFSGLDTFTYKESVGVGPASSAAQVVVDVSGFATGIYNISEGKTTIYPNPVSDKLYINTANPAISDFRIVDMLGSVVKAESFSNTTSVNVSGMNNGLYIIQFSSSDGKTILSSRFTVIK